VLNKLWDRIIEAAGHRLPSAVVDSWLRPCSLLAAADEQVRIAVPNPFTRDWIVQHHLAALTAAVQEVLGDPLRVVLTVDDRDPGPAPLVPEVVESRPAAGGHRAHLARIEGLNPRYTFDSFVVGSSNQFAQAASQAVAELPSRAYNPLFIYGGVGLGKTHLLHAIGHGTRRRAEAMTILYLSSERFTNELINAIRYDRTAEFRGRYRTIDLLLIDDIQFLSGKERTQEEFFHTFNDLYESRKQIVLSSDRPPKDINEIEERLRSRFEWGLIADIQPPDFETRVAILKKKAALERVRLDDDVAYLIAGRIKSNIRELEGSLTRMIAFCALTGRDMSVDLAHEVLADLWGEDEKVITIEQVQRKVCDHYGVRLSDLKAKNRTKAIAFPRQVAMYLARQLTHASLADVGRAFGGKDHTTVLHAVEKIEGLIEDDPKLRKTVEVLIQGMHL
jgi:chromosomal replication initiator protein